MRKQFVYPTRFVFGGEVTFSREVALPVPTSVPKWGLLSQHYSIK